MAGSCPRRSPRTRAAARKPIGLSDEHGLARSTASSTASARDPRTPWQPPRADAVLALVRHRLALLREPHNVSVTRLCLDATEQPLERVPARLSRRPRRWERVRTPPGPAGLLAKPIAIQTGLVEAPHAGGPGHRAGARHPLDPGRYVLVPGSADELIAIFRRGELVRRDASCLLPRAVRIARAEPVADTWPPASVRYLDNETEARQVVRHDRRMRRRASPGLAQCPPASVLRQAGSRMMVFAVKERRSPAEDEGNASSCASAGERRTRSARRASGASALPVRRGDAAQDLAQSSTANTTCRPGSR
jgi:hypothetical protein